jgi:hypothetical protein
MRWPKSLRRFARGPDAPLLTPPSPPPLVQAGPWSELAPPAPAPESAIRRISFLVRIGVEYGGDEFARITRPDGGSSRLIAGGLVAYDAGILYQPRAPFVLEVTLGWKLEADRFDNGDVTLERFPLDVIASWTSGDLRLGLGATIHIAPTIGCHVDGICDDSVSFATAFGGIVQVGYTFFRVGAHGGDFALRYTRITYSGDNAAMALDASCIGLFGDVWY